MQKEVFIQKASNAKIINYQCKNSNEMLDRPVIIEIWNIKTMFKVCSSLIVICVQKMGQKSKELFGLPM